MAFWAWGFLGLDTAPRGVPRSEGPQHARLWINGRAPGRVRGGWSGPWAGHLCAETHSHWPKVND
jgi:hypothetical protein